ncbi:spermatogenesis associated 6-like protein isoform X9 [Elephas maximus indicus]|uniref:spermatogenesis associated 6-like protein isoform X9 n=1 Tax=Elephas maximus indicus TaxID=99487 RepID=UPI002116EF3D|nr:spermatogenesis associated 6-like protein isoform X9 [Elephas maximus indicus]XP_049751245.1 spermatogenesis associated 6-like protein isoform X9 [Elephas maximus indicus]
MVTACYCHPRKVTPNPVPSSGFGLLVTPYSGYIWRQYIWAWASCQEKTRNLGIGPITVSCPGVFLPSKQAVYLGVYFLNQYLETDCFPAVFPIIIHQNLRFEKVFENAIDPGAVADILEGFLTRFELIQLVPPVWEKLAYYEENTRDFLFPEPKLRPSHPGTCREVLMRTAVGFPGIAPKLEFSTRTAIRERVCLHRNRFLEDRLNPQRPLSASPGPIFPLYSTKTKPKGKNLDRVPRGLQSRAPSPYPTRRLFQDQPTHLNFGNSFKISREIKPPFVVRHVDSAKPFGEAVSEHQSRKARRKCKLSDFPFPTRRGITSCLGNWGPDSRVVSSCGVAREASPWSRVRRSPFESSPRFFSRQPCS